MNAWQDFVFNFLNAQVMLKYLPYVLEGFVLTVLLALAVVVAGLAAGLALAALRSLGIRPVNVLIVFVVDLLRALPPLVIILLLFFGLPMVGLDLSGFMATWLSLTLVLMAFSEEIYWAGFNMVSRGQWEAARATGLNHMETLRHVVIPQAVRLTIPSLTNRVIVTTKGTALGAVVGVQEILGASQMAVAFSSNPSPLLLGCVAYIALFMPFLMLSRWVGRRYTLKR